MDGRYFVVNRDTLWFKYQQGEITDDQTRWGFRFFVQASFPLEYGKGDADAYREMVVASECLSRIRDYMRLPGTDFYDTRRYSSLVIGNLTMSERSKAQLLKNLGYTFFLQFPDDLIGQRNAALCLSELFEDKYNCATALLISDSLEGNLAKDILETLRNMSRSSDTITRNLAVKSFALLAACAHNVNTLLQNGVLEIFYKHAMQSVASTHFAWRGLRSLSGDVSRLMQYAREGPDRAKVVIDDLKEGLDDMYMLQGDPVGADMTLRLNVPLNKTGKMYYECTMYPGGTGLQAGFIHSNWVPTDRSPCIGGATHGSCVCTTKMNLWHGERFVDTTVINWRACSIIGVLITVDVEKVPHLTVGYTVNGVHAGVTTEVATPGNNVSVMPACTLSMKGYVGINIGATTFEHHPPEEFQSVLRYCRTNKISVPTGLEIWDMGSNMWRQIKDEDGISMASNSARRHRLWTVLSMLFLNTLKASDSFFTRPVEIESTHPNAATTAQHLVTRPGATAFDVQLAKLQFCNAIGAKEALRIYKDADERKVALHADRNDASVRSLIVFSDTLMLAWTSERPPNAVAGWGYKIYITPKYGEQAVLHDRTITCIEESKHPYIAPSTEIHHVCLDSAEAIMITFDPSSSIDNADMLRFYLDQECQLPVYGSEGYTNTNFPGIGDRPPLRIEQSEFYYTFTAVSAGNKWGYKFECTSCKTRFNEMLLVQGAVKIESAHPYRHPYNTDDFDCGKSVVDVMKVRVKGEYHSCVLFSSQSVLSLGDSLEIHLTDPSVDPPNIWETYTNSFPKETFYIPQTLFWVKFSMANASGLEYGFCFVAYPVYDPFTAMQCSVGATVVETLHPYLHDSNENYHIDLSAIPVVNGFREVAVVFDSRSATASNRDFLALALTENSTSYMNGDMRWSGRGGFHNFPFVGNPLILQFPEDESLLYARFVSEDSATDWGVRCVFYSPTAVVQYSCREDMEWKRADTTVEENQVHTYLVRHVPSLLEFCDGSRDIKIISMVACILCNLSSSLQCSAILHDDILSTLKSMLTLNDHWLSDVVAHIIKNIITEQNRLSILHCGIIALMMEAWVDNLGRVGYGSRTSMETDNIFAILASSEPESENYIGVLFSTLSPSHWCNHDSGVKVVALRALGFFATPPLSEAARAAFSLSSNISILLALLSKVNDADIIRRSLHVIQNLSHDESFLPMLTSADHMPSLQILFSLLLSSDETVSEDARQAVEILVLRNRLSSQGLAESDMLRSQYESHLKHSENIDKHVAPRPFSGLRLDRSMTGTSVVHAVASSRPQCVRPASWNSDIPLEGDKQGKYQALFWSKLRCEKATNTGTEAMGFVHDEVAKSSAITISMWIYVDTECFASLAAETEKHALESVFFVLGSAAKGKQLSLAVSSSGQLVAGIPYLSQDVNKQIRIVSKNKIIPSSWCFVALSVDFTSPNIMRAAMFHDNSEVAAAFVDNARSSLCVITSHPWLLGIACELGLKHKRMIFNGAIENCRLYGHPAIGNVPDFLVDAYACKPHGITQLCAIFRAAEPVIHEVAKRMDDVAGTDDSSSNSVSLKGIKILLLLSGSDLCASFILNKKIGGRTLLPRIIKLAKSAHDVLAEAAVPDVQPVSIESAHPYPCGMSGDTPYELSWAEGADKQSAYTGLKIWFDSWSSSELNYDYVQLFSVPDDSNPTSRIGTKFSGGYRGSTKNYPTKDNPLFVAHLKVWARFYSDGDTADWGWKIYALPVTESFLSIENDFTVIESTHPYGPNENVYQTIEVPGDTAVVYFSSDTETEYNYDYVRFFKDDSYTECWGLDKYSGGRAGSEKNFPSRDTPLVIPAKKFVFNFVSDGRYVLCNAYWLLMIFVEYTAMNVGDIRCIFCLFPKRWFLRR